MRLFRWSVLLGYGLVLCAQGQLQVSEVMTCNTSTYQDRFGDFPDWIELRAEGKESVDLARYSLAAGSGEPWPLPRLLVRPGRRVVLFASGREPWQPRDYHVPFRLRGWGIVAVDRA